MIEYDKFKMSLKHLELQYENYIRIDSRQPVLIQEAVKESVIQRFETCYDCLWKILKRYLVENLGIPEVPNSPKSIMRMANENNLFSSPIEQWLKYANARISTSHDYSGEKAVACLQIMGNFVSDAVTLYSLLSGESWN